MHSRQQEAKKKVSRKNDSNNITIFINIHRICILILYICLCFHSYLDLRCRHIGGFFISKFKKNLRIKNNLYLCPELIKQHNMKKHLLTNRLLKVERLTRFAMQDKNILKIRQGFHLMKELREQIADISTPKLIHV